MRIAVLLLLTALLYAPSVARNGWVYEDTNAISQNDTVTGVSRIPVDRARWLSATSHRIVYTISKTPQAAHLANLLLHLVNGWLVLLVARKFMPERSALLVAALFLLHPLQVEAVSYAASRSELLSACLALGAFVMAHGRRAWWRGALIWLLVALAVCAKESAAVIVPLIAVSYWVQGQPLARLRLALLLVPIGLITITVLRYDYLSHSELGHLDYAATQATAVWRYLRLAAWPVGQTIDHDWELTPYLWRYVALTALWGLALVPLFGALSVGGERQGRLWVWWGAQQHPLVFGVSWLLIALAPRLIMRIPEMLNEHQTYLPFVGVWIVVGATLGRLVKETYAQREAPGSGEAGTSLAAPCAG